MHILIVAATKIEIEPLLMELNASHNEFNLFSSSFHSHQIDILITGIGPIAMAVNLMAYLNKHKADMLINAGICGSYSPHLTIGSLIQVKNDIFIDLCFSNNSNPAINQGTWVDQSPACSRMLSSNSIPDSMAIPVNAVTVCRSSSSLKEASERAVLFNAQVESMEGAAFFYAAQVTQVPFIQLRAISNMAGDSDLKNWNIKLASESLSQLLMQLLSSDTL